MKVNSHSFGFVYTKRIVELFSQKGAAERFLSPIGLSLQKSIPIGFDSDESSFTPEQEINFFKAMHFLKYWIGRCSSNSKRVKLLRRYNAIRNRIICANIGLIYKCMKMTSVHADTDTLTSAGHIALLEASEKFNPFLGIRFSTYASVSILRRFTREIRRKQLPIDEIDPAEVLDNHETHEEKEERQHLMKHLNHLLDAESGVLSEDDIDILKLRFNLGCFLPRRKTLDQIAASRGKSKERIRQLQKNAIHKLRNAFGICSRYQ